MEIEHLGTFDADRIKRIAGEVARRAGSRKDVVAARGKLGVAELEAGGLALTVKNGEERAFPLERQALVQLAGTLDVPVRYLERLTDAGHHDIAATTLGELLAREEVEKRHLVRTLDGRVDAFLSDRYRAIGHEDVLAVAVEEFDRIGRETGTRPQLWDLRLTSTEFRLLAVAPHISGEVTTDRSFTGQYRWQGKAGDVLNAAVSLGNSETGHGSFYGKPAILRHVCQNFCVWADGVARVHLGKRLEEGEQHFVSDETRSLEDRALVSKLRDVIRTTFDPKKFKAAIDAINATTTRGLGDSPVQVIDAAVKVYGIPQERKDAILNSLLETGDVTQYGLVQAITAQVNPANAGTLGDAERNAFEDAGGALLKLNAETWRRFLSNAYSVKPEALEAEAAATVSVRRV